MPWSFLATNFSDWHLPLASCPVCSKNVHVKHINSHLDACLRQKVPKRKHRCWLIFPFFVLVYSIYINFPVKGLSNLSSYFIKVFKGVCFFKRGFKFHQISFLLHLVFNSVLKCTLTVAFLNPLKKFPCSNHFTHFFSCGLLKLASWSWFIRIYWSQSLAIYLITFCNQTTGRNSDLLT